MKQQVPRDYININFHDGNIWSTTTVCLKINFHTCNDPSRASNRVTSVLRSCCRQVAPVIRYQSRKAYTQRLRFGIFIITYTFDAALIAPFHTPQMRFRRTSILMHLGLQPLYVQRVMQHQSPLDPLQLFGDLKEVLTLYLSLIHI